MLDMREREFSIVIINECVLDLDVTVNSNIEQHRRDKWHILILQTR